MFAARIAFNGGQPAIRFGTHAGLLALAAEFGSRVYRHPFGPPGFPGSIRVATADDEASYEAARAKAADLSRGALQLFDHRGVRP